MTVGEKIQFYRKRIRLSQEELGRQLLVSRQTVSLWEMDKTLPTVDNLLRLKEIFSVSIDDILSKDDPADESDGKVQADAAAATEEEAWAWRSSLGSMGRRKPYQRDQDQCWKSLLSNLCLPP